MIISIEEEIQNLFNNFGIDKDELFTLSFKQFNFQRTKTFYDEEGYLCEEIIAKPKRKRVFRKRKIVKF